MYSTYDEIGSVPLCPLELYREGQLNCENVLAIICGRRMKPGRRGARKGSLGTWRERHSSTDLQHKWQKIKLATPGWVQTAASISGQPQGMSTQQPDPPRTPETAKYWNSHILLGDFRRGFWPQENRAGAGTAWMQLPSYSGSCGAAESVIPELARIKPAWDCLWLQCSLGSNWPWLSTTPNAEMWVLTHSMVRRATQALWRHQGNHSSPTRQDLHPAVPLERFVQPLDRSWQPQAASLSHPQRGVTLQTHRMGTSL